MIRSSENFRPWGDLTQILSVDSPSDWSFIGCVSFEDRCITSYDVLRQHHHIAKSLIFRIRDEESSSSTAIEAKIDKMENAFSDCGLEKSSIVSKKLLDSFNEYAEEIDNFYSTLDVPNLIIDVSSLPKRVFFFIIKRALTADSSIKNIHITYSNAGKYGDGPLAENPERWATLPGFTGPHSPPNDKVAIIAVGYEPLGLPEIAVSGEFQTAKVKLLFPFPSVPESVAKHWKFTRTIFPNLDTNAVDISRVDGINVPEIYDMLMKLTDDGNKYSILAPYGPKPMSIAMALFATKFEGAAYSPSVFYTQPKNYNINYSSGVRVVDGFPVINSYFVRLNGQNIY